MEKLFGRDKWKIMQQNKYGLYTDYLKMAKTQSFWKTDDSFSEFQSNITGVPC